MYVILTYDIGVKRNGKVLRICRKYLRPVQKSVFEGDITERKLEKLKSELKKVIKPEDDQIAIYRLQSVRYSEKEMIGYHKQTDNVI